MKPITNIIRKITYLHKVIEIGTRILITSANMFKFALVKDIVGESEHLLENVSQRFSTRFAVDSAS